MVKTIIRTIVRAFIGIGNIRKRMEERSQQKKLDAAKYYSKRFCYIQDYKGKPYVGCATFRRSPSRTTPTTARTFSRSARRATSWNA